MKPFIDYLTFSIKTDHTSQNPAMINRDYIFTFLNLSQEDFTDIGRKGYYEHCYTSNNINVYQPYEEKADTQGWLVSMTGQGCRYYEQARKDLLPFEFSFWRDFCIQLRDLNNHGCSINVSRIDIACDDYDKLLDLNLIWESANAREFVSQFRNAYEKGYDNILTGECKGRTIYFGSRKSATLCRFYDKLIEQKQKNANNPEMLKELDNISHWIRMEFEFKREQAVKIVNIICDADNFGKYYAEVVNAYVRFVKNTDINVTRRPMQKWWRRFIGTVRRSSLSVGQYKGFSYEKTLSYYDRYLTTTVYTILSRMDIEDFFTLTYKSACNRLKLKHRAIMDDVKCNYDLNPALWWDFLNPVKYKERTDLCATELCM